MSGSGIAVTADGSVWLTGSDESPPTAPYMFEASGAKLTGSVPLPGVPAGTTVGPNGALWFADTTNDDADWIHPDTGDITGYPVNAGRPGAITTASDGNLWIGTTLPALVRMSVAGQTTPIPEIAVPPAANNAIVAGPDDAVWYISGTSLYRQDLTAGLSVYPVPVAHGGPVSLTIGSDSNVWVLTHAMYVYDRQRIITANPPAITFHNGQRVSVTISEVGYAGTFIAHTINNGCVITPFRPAKTFKVRPPYVGTSCIVYFTDRKKVGTVYVYANDASPRRR